MSGKKVTIGAKPTARPGAPNIDAWARGRSPFEEPTKRFTIDVPVSLHQRVKIQCAMRDKHMADVVRELLEAHFPGATKE